MTAMAIKCRTPVMEWPPVWESAKAVSAGSSIPIAVMAYLRDERVDRGGATDMCSKQQDKRSKRENLVQLFAKMEEFFASPSTKLIKIAWYNTSIKSLQKVSGLSSQLAPQGAQGHRGRPRRMFWGKWSSPFKKKRDAARSSPGPNRGPLSWRRDPRPNYFPRRAAGEPRR